MLTKLKIPQRLHAGFILAIAFLLVLGSNRLYQRHFSTLQNTVNSVYEDRIKVQDYIYQLNNIFQIKQIRFITAGDFTPITSENEKVNKILSDFAITELTTEEHKALNELTLQFEKLKKSEEKTVQLKGNISALPLNFLEVINQQLNILATIQLEESRQMTQLSNKALESNLLMSKLSFAFLILIGLALLVLILYPIKAQQPILE
ncbi:hypothetical protein [Maribacter sp. Asnod1-A12]|uniref:hypothetical protein n=1 Tax=Maribacter sp. Asnod1-A12 TaxID=3160576 RepID=UPI003863852E